MKQLTSKSSQSILSLAKVLLMSKLVGILKVRKEPLNKKCLILGNGPSLNQSIEKYKNLFNNYDLVCVNNFAYSPIYIELKPKFYIISAHIIFYPEHKISKKYIDIRNEFFENIALKTEWNLYLMVPFIAKKSTYFSTFIKNNKHITPIYFNTTAIEGIPALNHFFFRKGFGTPRPHNVLIPTIMNCIYLGYEEINIIGADHSWLPEISVNDQNEALVNQKHFYDETESSPEKMEDYIVRPRRLHEIIHKFYLSFKGYWEIKKYAQSRNIKIYNASEFSMIDAFDRKKLK